MIRVLSIAAAMLLGCVQAQQTGQCGTGEIWDGTKCVSSGCPSGTYADSTGTCVPGCPPSTYSYLNTCVSTCPKGTYKYGSSCVGSCPALIYNNTCVDACPIEAPLRYNNMCMNACPPNTVTYGDRCLNSCPVGQFAYAGTCYSSCPTNAAYIYNGWCVDECWKMGLYYEGPGAMKCVSSCPAVYQNATKTCVDRCRPEQKMLAGGCYDACPPTIPYTLNGTCTTACPNYVNVTDLRCVNTCPIGTVLNGKRCEPPLSTCPTYMYRNTTDGTCTYWCGPDMIGFNGTCVRNCPSTAPFSNGGKCVERCPDGFIGIRITGYCDCAGFWTNNGTCVNSCPTGMVSVYDKYCTEKCPADMKQNGTRCDPLCGPGQILMNGACVDGGFWNNGGNWTNGGCKPYEYMNSNGTCILYGPTCAPDQWFWNGTCIPACREGEALTMDGKCMNIAEICLSVLPGSIMNNVTHKCECPVGFWITRDRTATDPTRPPIRCAPVPFSGQAPRINCPSFVANAVYVDSLDHCVCPSTYPIIVPLANTTWFPYACAPPGIMSPIKQCVWPSYFDFLEGRCVGSSSDSGSTPTVKPTASMMPSIRPDVESATMTAKVRPSSTATALPSRYPSRSASTTRTPAPSAIPGSPTPSTTPSRSVKPSGLVFAADASRLPLPSLVAVRPPPAAVQKSPAPSPWPKRVALELPPEEKPAYIDARMTIAGANATEMAKPERIQQVQASLACTLRMPLENIRIQNITMKYANGVESRIPVDPTAFMMVGDGSSDCYEFRNMTSGGARRLRALSDATTGAIHIDYTIVAPSDEILAMDTAQFNDVLSKSPVLVAAASSVGGTEVTAIATDTYRAIDNTPSTSSSPTVSGGIDLRLAFGIIVSCSIVAIFAITLSIFYCRETANTTNNPTKTPAEQTQTSVTPRVVLVYEDQRQHQITNPLAARAVFANTDRIDYSPQTSRHSVQPVRQTHRPLFGTDV